MARTGHKYPLIVYRHMLNRWWPAMIAMGLGMFALAYSEYLEPLGRFLPWRWQLFAVIGAVAILIGIFFWIIRFFAYKSMSGWVRDIFSPLANKTALVIDLNGYPISPVLLRLFLSRFFFKDKTSHLVILVKDWMRFSAELESMRSGIDPNSPVQKRSKKSILSRLPQK